MKLTFFEVENFRSIGSKTRCDVDSRITVLAGKNESGKSNLLHALKAFSTTFEETDVPEGKGGIPTVTLHYTIERDELVNLARSIFEMQDGEEFEVILPNKPFSVTFCRKYGEDKIIVSGEAITALKELKEGELNYWSSRVDKLIKEISSAEVLQRHRDKLQAEIEQEDAPSWLQALGALVLSLQNTPDAEKLTEYKVELEQCKASLDFYAKEIDFGTPLWKMAPKFVLFDSFEDILPAQADERDVEEKEILQRFFALCGIEPEVIFREESPKKRKLIVNNVSNQISGDFCGYYNQSTVKLTMDVDGDSVQFYVYDADGTTPFYPSQRSKGFQWFLSFYLTLKSVGLESNHIILIDEPGLYLHAKAQQDMLKILENLSEQHQIIFSTHSPYLIDTAHLHRVRLVMRDTSTGNTIIENKIQKVADKDTLTPIVTAIGYDLAQGLTVGRKTNIITEGISDYYYLSSFFKLVSAPRLHDIAIIPAVGADQVPNIASILYGWGVDCVALLDNDTKGRATHAKLVKNLGFKDGVNVFFVSLNEGDSIEDLFTSDDFYQWVLNESPPKNSDTKKNSVLAKDRKVTLAKTFYDRVCNENVRLSTETLDNVVNLLQRMGLPSKQMVSA
jgi:predicted ATP-dependent endonuclease of OLD family